jgi:nicotinamide riboside transporter PnuC
MEGKHRWLNFLWSQKKKKKKKKRKTKTNFLKNGKSRVKIFMSTTLLELALATKRTQINESQFQQREQKLEYLINGLFKCSILTSALKVK